MNKRLIRKICKEIRIKKSLNVRLSESRSIQKSLFSEIDFSEYKNVFIYLSALEKGEVDTWNIIPELSSNNIYVPKMVNDEMKTAEYSERFSMNKFGILECDNVVEVKIDLAIIPILSFNKDLYRIGYGGGYYDKFLKDNKCLKIGLCADNMRDWVQDEYDISLDMIVTPDRIYSRK
jgi:5-formyltetrahydrofolate cyclo-ligase